MTDFIPDRLNEAPSVFYGCTWAEIGISAAVSAAASLALGVLFAVVTGFYVIVLGFLVIGTLSGVFIIAKVLQRVKRGKPIGYYKIKHTLLMQRLGLKENTVINESRVWDVERCQK